MKGWREGGMDGWTDGGSARFARLLLSSCPLCHPEEEEEEERGTPLRQMHQCPLPEGPSEANLAPGNPSILRNLVCFKSCCRISCQINCSWEVPVGIVETISVLNVWYEDVAKELQPFTAGYATSILFSQNDVYILENATAWVESRTQDGRLLRSENRTFLFHQAMVCHVQENVPYEVQIRYRISHWSSYWSDWSPSVVVPVASSVVAFGFDQSLWTEWACGFEPRLPSLQGPSPDQGMVNYTLVFVLLLCQGCLTEMETFVATVCNQTSYQVALSGAAYNISLQAANKAGKALASFVRLPPEQEAGSNILNVSLSGQNFKAWWKAPVDADICFESQALGDFPLEMSSSLEDPIYVNVTKRTSHSATVRWEPPGVILACPGVLKKFVVCCQKDEEGAQTTYYDANASKREFTIPDLQPQTGYLVGVWASTDGSGKDCKAHLVFLTSPPDAKPTALAQSFLALGIFVAFLTAAGSCWHFGRK
ncbi:hypothetical protein JD844_033903 [Phrynosoma platyrhinos]|uniref:Fibronectin type-III domain-containing protein n=1 Tax=Phrynosoma platyrhinos TaxID=52577 RepID=A0ABQ7T7S5_PHRPL|nr:hypothetical protein JD844_033903 [Phrynosoma platyrhinos]